MITRKPKKIVRSSIVIALMAMPLANIACAQESITPSERVIEEVLIYKDPTVARPNQWVGGISLDYFNETAVFPVSGTNVKKNVSEPGIGAWVGYGDISVLFSHRRGSVDLGGTLSTGVNFDAEADVKQTTIDVRWLVRSLSTSFMTPYVTVGYRRLETDTAGRATGAGFFPFVVTRSTTFDGPVYGIGAILPVNEKIGFRVDGKYFTADGKYETTSYSEGRVPSDFKGEWGTVADGKQSIITGTMYYNLTDNTNLQVGGMRLRQHSGDNRRTDTGYFALLGYRF